MRIPPPLFKCCAQRAVRWQKFIVTTQGIYEKIYDAAASLGSLQIAL